MADVNLQDVHDFLVEIAYKAGEMITTAHPTTGDSGSKKNSADLVTETDKAVEEMVSSSLREKYPDYGFMGEETAQETTTLEAIPTFIVDPIDGTTNFVHGYPYVSISLGLAVNKVPSVGVVYNPFTQVIYTAITGKGAFRNRTTQLPLMPQRPLENLDNALVAIEWGSDRGNEDFEVKHKTFARLCRTKEQDGAMVHGLRSFGSAALNLCAVAEGGIDVYWESGCYAWDVCAGWVVLMEAGGMIVDGNPGGWEPRVDCRRYLALRNGAATEVVEQFWRCIEGKLTYGPPDENRAAF